MIITNKLAMALTVCGPANALRIWLTPDDGLSLIHETRSTKGPLYFMGVPVSVDPWWAQPSRIIYGDGQRIYF